MAKGIQAILPTSLQASPASYGFEPAYFKLRRSGELEARVRQAFVELRSCDLCARYCHVNRLFTIQGAVCRTGERTVVHSFEPHHGEEGVLRGWRGSGTIFFSWCNLRCVFCQNWEISHKGIGCAVDPKEIALMLLELQAEGCHNINLVSPSHVVAKSLLRSISPPRKGCFCRWSTIRAAMTVLKLWPCWTVSSIFTCLT